YAGGRAVDARLRAEREMGRVRDADRVEPRSLGQELRVGRLELAEDRALVALVHGRARRVAEPDFAEELGVVGHGGEVERAVDAGAPRLRLVVVGERDGGSARE